MFKLPKNFDKSYFILVWPILVETVPWIATRTRLIFPFIFSLTWFLFARNNFNFSPLYPILRNRFMKLVFWMVVCFFIKEVYALCGHGDHCRYDQLSTFLQSLVLIIVGYLSLKRERFYEIKFLSYVAMLGFAVAGLMSLRGGTSTLLGESIEGARAMTGVDLGRASLETLEKFAVARYYGMGNYSFMYICALIVPLCVWAAWKIKRYKIKLVFLAGSVGALLCVKYGGLGTPVFVMLISVILYFTGLIVSNRKFIFSVGLFFSVFLLVFSVKPDFLSFTSPVLRIAANLFPHDSSIAYRFTSVADAVEGDIDAYAVQRYQLQLASWNTFLAYPAFGKGAYNPYSQKSYESSRRDSRTSIGGHSGILDRLAQFGIIGSIPLFMFYISAYGYTFLMLRYLGELRPLPLSIVYLCSFIFASVANPLTFISGTYYIILAGIALFLRDKSYETRYI